MEQFEYTDPWGRTHKGSAANVEWYAWSDKLWVSMCGLCGPATQLSALAHSEQKTMRSHAEKRCECCGDPGTVEYPTHLVKVVKTYWLCTECDNWYKAKYADTTEAEVA